MSIKIHMVNLQSQYLRIKSEIDDAIEEVLNAAAFIQGPQVQQFANALKNYVGAGFCIPCANGTDAFQIANWRSKQSRALCNAIGKRPKLTVFGND